MTNSKPLRVNITCSDITHSMLQRLAERGMFGKNRAEIANHIIERWLWDNEEKLARQGIPYAIEASSAKLEAFDGGQTDVAD